MTESVCVNGRFCWKRLDFPGWDNIFSAGEDFVLTTYNNWTPPILVGDGKRYLEVDPIKYFSNRQVLSPCVWRENGRLRVGLGPSYPAEEFSTLSDAIARMLFLQGDPQLFNPDFIYLPGKGKLKTNLNSPDSVLLILPLWHPAKSSEENRNSSGRWYHFIRSREVQKRFRHKILAGLSRYKVSSIELRCGGFNINDDLPLEQYSLSDYRADGLCLILSNKTHSPADMESFKSDYIQLAYEFGLKAIFYKEKNSFWAIHTRFPYKYERIAGKGTQPLFDFLVDFYNYEAQANSYRVPYIDEEIDRSAIPRCGSFAGAIAYYQSQSPVRRSQWCRIRQDGLEN